MMVCFSQVWEAIAKRDQELCTADLFCELGKSEEALLSVKRAQKLTGFIDCKREETEKTLVKQLEEEEKMQEQNNKL